MKVSIRKTCVLASLLCCGFFKSSSAETYTLNTYYPSPVGVYDNVTVTSTTALATKGGNVIVGNPSDAAGHKLAVEGSLDAEYMEYGKTADLTAAEKLLLPGEDVPKPGRLFYNVDHDQFYFSSKDAVQSDQSTWFKPVSGFDSAVVAEGHISTPYVLLASLSRARPFVATVGIPAPYYAAGVGPKTNLTKSGLYIISSDVTFCSTTGFTDKPVNIRLNASYTQVASISDDTTLAPGACKDFSLQGMSIFRAGINPKFFVFSKRTVNSDYLKAVTIKVERVISF